MISKKEARKIGELLARDINCSVDEICFLPADEDYPAIFTVDCLDENGEQFICGTPGGIQKAIVAEDGSLVDYCLPFPASY